MQTVRQIERLWNARQYQKLFRELLANRPEAMFLLDLEPHIGSAAAAAIGVIRLDELNQPHVPLYSALIRALIATQDRDGGWGDAAITALALRALMSGRNTGGEAIQRGLAYLAGLQKDDGLWPKVPLRRMPADVAVSAFVLHQLGDDPRFRDAVRFAETIRWFEANSRSMDESDRRLWDRAKIRCAVRRNMLEPMLMWS